MKTIRTVYRNSPPKYMADDGDGNRIFVPVNEIEQELGDGNWSPDRYHRFAAQKLCEKMGWSGEFVTGFFDVEAYHVFLDRKQSAAPELLDLLRAAIARVEIANNEGNPILSAWLVDAKAAIEKATGVQ